MTATATPSHRVSRAVAGMRATCTDLTDTPLWSMSGPETAQTIGEVTRLEAQLSALKAHLLVRTEEAEVPAEIGATSTKAWLAATTRLTGREAHRQTKLATATSRARLSRRGGCTSSRPRSSSKPSPNCPTTSTRISSRRPSSI